jgi:hypothetical protein
MKFVPFVAENLCNFARIPRAVHGDEWHPFSSPPSVGGVRGGGKWERIFTPTFVLPHPRHNSGGIFDKGEEIVFKEIGKPHPVGGVIHSNLLCLTMAQKFRNLGIQGLGINNKDFTANP